MTKPILLSRAVAQATAAFCACALACALQGAFAGPASAFTPTTKAGGENTPLNLGGTAGTTHSTSSGGASIVRTIVGLAIVLAVIWGLAWIMRQVKSAREGGGRGSQPSSAELASVAALTLGSGRSVHLVRAGNDYVLLGAAEHGVAPIHRYTEEQALEAGLLPDGCSLSSPSSARAWARSRPARRRRRPARARGAARVPSAGAGYEDGGIPAGASMSRAARSPPAGTPGRTRCGCPPPPRACSSACAK